MDQRELVKHHWLNIEKNINNIYQYENGIKNFQIILQNEYEEFLKSCTKSDLYKFYKVNLKGIDDLYKLFTDMIRFILPEVSGKMGINKIQRESNKKGNHALSIY